jgi:dihydroflavonol-4-reductase
MVGHVKVFVTGGTGFIGSAVVRQLRARGDDVVALVRNPAKGAPLEALGCTLVAGDLNDERAIRAGMAGCDAVIHAAAVYEVGIPASERRSMQEANVGGTERVLGAALEAQVPKVVYVSTVGIFGNTHGRVVDETYENPADNFTSEYEKTKWEAHKAAQRLIGEGLPCVIVQPGGVYGPGDESATGRLLEQFLEGKMPLIPFPELGICLTHVEDIAAGILLGLDKGVAGEAYVISGPVTTVREAIGVVAAATGKKAPKHAMPTGLMKLMTPFGGLVGKVMNQPPNLRELISSADGVTFWANHEKATRELGYEPRGLQEGIEAMLKAEGRLPVRPAA